MTSFHPSPISFFTENLYIFNIVIVSCRYLKSNLPVHMDPVESSVFFRGLKRMFNFMPSGPIIQPLPTDPFLTIYFSKFSFHEYRSSCNAGKLHIY